MVNKQEHKLERAQPLTVDVLKMIIGRHRAVMIFGPQSVDGTYVHDHEALIIEIGRLRRELGEIKKVNHSAPNGKVSRRS